MRWYVIGRLLLLTSLGCRRTVPTAAENLLAMSGLKTPVVSIIIGEGGSGGALALGVADRVLMLENAIYSVASPEAAASILWKDGGRGAEAAEAMRITAADLLRFGIVDAIIAEPSGGAHTDHRTKFACAVSISENPLAGFHLYWWDAVAHDGVANDAVFKPGDWGDYPSLGIDVRCIYQTNHVANAVDFRDQRAFLCRNPKSGAQPP